MNRNTFYIIFAALTFGLLINSFFVVNEKERAIVFQFGEAVFLSEQRNNLWSHFFLVDC